MKLIIEVNGDEVTIEESEAIRIYDELGKVFGVNKDTRIFIPTERDIQFDHPPIVPYCQKVDMDETKIAGITFSTCKPRG